MRLPRTRRAWLPVVLVALAVVTALVVALLALRTPEPPEPGLPAAGRADAGPSARNGALVEYVALGDSYAAGPGVPDRPGGRSYAYAKACARSTANYPQLVAEELDLELDDRSCSGAAPIELETGQETLAGVRVPPQLGALSRKTDLVTLSVGGNELGLAGRIIQTCLRAAELLPAAEAPCADRFGDDGLRRVAEGADAAESAVIRLLEEIGRRAPRARIVLVGYVNYFPARDSCPASTGLASGDFGYLRSAYTLLVAATRRAAQRAGAEYVDPLRVFDGHLLCSEQPFISGATDDQGAFHPNASGQRALAEVVLEALEQGAQ